MADVDIVVSGGGVVGTAFALACELLRYRTLLIDAPSTRDTKGHLGFDLRTVALSPQSVSWLNARHGNVNLPKQGVNRMHIWEQLGTSTIDFCCAEVGTDALAWILEHSVVATTLRDAYDDKGGNIQCGTISTLEDSEKRLLLSNGTSITCNLLVIAEGPVSETRELLGTQWTSNDLRQHAITTVITTEGTHNETAWQRFGNGILAFLPLTEPRTHAVVWSVPNSQFRELQSLNENQFKERLTSESDRVCGNVLKVDQRLSFPLMHGLASTFQPRPWVFILGDSAHTIHPLAGQGMNLGLEDARALESVLQTSTPGQPVSTMKLSALAERRRAKAIIMQQIMSLFDNTWRWNDPLSHWFRNFGVRVFTRLPALKKQVIREAMGIGPMTSIQ